MNRLLPPLILLVVWFGIAQSTGPHQSEEAAVREGLQIALIDLAEQEGGVWASHFSSGVKRVTNIYPLQFDERDASQYAQAVWNQVENPGVDICQDGVRITGVFAVVDLHYRRATTGEAMDLIGQGRAHLIREGSTWRITNVEIF